jgi:5,6,7,8-tetrahydromethanopterin hydro-lyase
MAKIDRMLVGESLVGDGNEVAHIDLLIGPRGSAAETAFANCLTNNKDGFTSLLAVVAPNLLTKPATVMFNKVTIKGAKQAVQMFGPAQRAVAMAVADCVEDGTIPADEADNLFISVGVFIHWLAEDDAKIQKYNYEATKESIKRAVSGEPRAADVVGQEGLGGAPVPGQVIGGPPAARVHAPRRRGWPQCPAKGPSRALFACGAGGPVSVGHPAPCRPR